jgi:hypothetical protein
MRGPCQNSSCTFSATNTCVLGNPPEDCENRPLIDGDDDDDVAEDEPGTEEAEEETPVADAARGSGVVGMPVLTAPDDGMRSLPASRTLGIAQVNAIMENRPACLVGIVGLAGAGKTAALVSAYLLLSNGVFEGFSYADSDTLRAFEEITRASRIWQKGNPPEQITVHTTLSNDREAGFLHLRLRRDADDRIFDMLLPDLPGEWSRALIDRNDADRLEFLKSSSVIWMMVDGRQFANAARVTRARYRAKLLIERLADMLDGSRPRLMIVPTWQDKIAFPQAEADTLRECGRSFGFEVDLAPIASFSWDEDMEPGHGVADLFSRTLTAGPPPPDFWPVTDRSADDRKLASYRRDA